MCLKVSCFSCDDSNIHTWRRQKTFTVTLECIYSFIIIIIIIMQCNLQSVQLIWECIAENNHSYKNIRLLVLRVVLVASVKLLFYCPAPKKSRYKQQRAATPASSSTAESTTDSLGTLCWSCSNKSSRKPRVIICYQNLLFHSNCINWWSNVFFVFQIIFYCFLCVSSLSWAPVDS